MGNGWEKNGRFLGNGDGSFQTPDYYLNGEQWAPWVVTCDLNQDGKRDIAATRAADSGG